jgi:L-amino acid N-acyltransferase YncA
MTTTKEHPKNMSEADVSSMVAQLDGALERGEVTVVPTAVLRELRAAAAARRAAEERVESAVANARNVGLSWGIVGAQLGITRQGARQRYEASR